MHIHTCNAQTNSIHCKSMVKSVHKGRWLHLLVNSQHCELRMSKEELSWYVFHKTLVSKDNHFHYFIDLSFYYWLVMTCGLWSVVLVVSISGSNLDECVVCSNTGVIWTSGSSNPDPIPLFVWALQTMARQISQWNFISDSAIVTLLIVALFLNRFSQSFLVLLHNFYKIGGGGGWFLQFSEKLEIAC